MSEISNKTISALLVLAIVASLGGTMLVLNKDTPVLLTGFAGTTETGTTALNITEVVSITLTAASVDWGNIAINNSVTNPICYLDTTTADGNANCTVQTSTTAGMTLRNDGNVNVTITYAATNISSNFLGGNDADESYKIYASTTVGACDNITVSTPTNVVASATTLCGAAVTGAPNLGIGGMDYSDASDDLDIDFVVTVGESTTPGKKTDSITFTAASINA